MSPIAIPVWAFAAAIRCGAPTVSYDTTLVFGAAESTFRQYVVHSNVTGETLDQGNLADALTTARVWLDRDGSIDVGWLQLNFTRSSGPGISLVQAFNACSAARASAKIMAGGWEECPQRSEKARLSCMARVYNTGREDSGYGYAARIWQTAAQVVPSIEKLMATHRTKNHGKSKKHRHTR